LRAEGEENMAAGWPDAITTAKSSILQRRRRQMTWTISPNGATLSETYWRQKFRRKNPGISQVPPTSRSLPRLPRPKSNPFQRTPR
jgi:hypothetical protein